MGITSFKFLLLVLISLIICRFLSVKYRSAVLITASIIFYISYTPAALLYIISASLVAWISALIIQRIKQKCESEILSCNADKQRKAEIKKIYAGRINTIKSVSVILLLLCLFFCKYFKLFAINNDKLSVSFILVPLGISYYTLTLISYVTDVSRNIIDADSNPLNVFLYAVFFLTIMQGPFCRYNDVVPQLKNVNACTSKFEIKKNMIRIIWGVLKKLCIADQMAIVANEVFSNYSVYSNAIILLGILCFTVQLYADFSGYMDIIIGCGGIFGIKLPENFNQPFFSETVSEFWRRWHITLGRWLQDYVFYPILRTDFLKKTGKKISKRFGKKAGRTIPTYIGMLVLWVLIGFWHGAGLNYVFGVGILQFIYILLEEQIYPHIGSFFNLKGFKIKSKVAHSLRCIRTTILMSGSWVFFRADNIFHAAGIFRNLFRTDIPMNGKLTWLFQYESSSLFNQQVYCWLPYIIFSILILLAADLLKEKEIDIAEIILSFDKLKKTIIVVAVLLFFIIFGAYGSDYSSANFIYFNF